MNDYLKLIATQGAETLRPTKPAGPATPAERTASKSDDDFEKVFEQVSSEQSKQSESPNTPVKKDEDVSSDSENGLAADEKIKTTAGEEGSSRSASLSPNDPDMVQEQNAAQQVQVKLNEVVQELFQTSGGESPFPVEQKPVAVEPGFAAFLEQQKVGAESAKAKLVVPVAEVNPNAVAEVVKLVPDQVPVDPLLSQLKNEFSNSLPNGKEQAIEKELARLAQEEIPELESFQAPVLKAPVAKVEVAKPSAQPVANAQPVEKEIQPELVSQLKPFEIEKPLTEAEKSVIQPFEGRLQKGQLSEKFEDLEHLNQAKAPASNALHTSSIFDEFVREQISHAGNAKDELSSFGSELKSDKNGLQAPIHLTDNSLADKGKLESKPSFSEVLPHARVQPGSLEDQVLRQIKMKLAPGLSQVQINLFPPELGSLRIRFELEGDRMKARVEAQQGVTATLLERHLPELKSAMSQAGIEVKEFEILNGQQADGFAFAQPHQNEEKRHESSQAQSGFQGLDGEYESEEVQALKAERELVISRAGGGISYIV